MVDKEELLLLKKVERHASAHLINPHDPRYLEEVREALASLKRFRDSRA